jgi:hypothetical protein
MSAILAARSVAKLHVSVRRCIREEFVSVRADLNRR